MMIFRLLLLAVLLPLLALVSVVVCLAGPVALPVVAALLRPDWDKVRLRLQLRLHLHLLLRQSQCLS